MKKESRLPNFQVNLLAEKEGEEFPWKARLEPLARKVLIEEGHPENVNIVMCSDQMVRELNHQYRKLDKVTDVLSFEWHEDYLLGEIYIAHDQVKRQAPKFGNTFYMELKRMIVHGLLHLSGYDHHTVPERVVMRRREREILGIDPYRHGKKKTEKTAKAAQKKGKN
ncbi:MULTISPECIES: rRNA maturation RNase YbeY [Hallerella]|uniref:Endoribonuclease YbeY n=1 Tax=Hallerella succinigenes TaxID=1896222 RepID=A0A2M9A947_9BACT|nr:MULTISPECIES: rRNA maturation RNase YbeY [Hallerella]MCI6872589.1 rRNA maturation RNase YbeY [Hallerella sp.]MDD6092349.1 rRNA maturation RNase YbeY [Hallerella succinigenes]MDY5028357.1 rRNA maturation RNase YbeY [Hallerella succinigenes]PJJ42143.1 putative rRNA maturation factor [Hallerella succinigenes]